MDPRLLILAGTFAVIVVTLVALLVLALSGRRSSHQHAPVSQFPHAALPPAPENAEIDTSLDGLRVDVPDDSPYAALLTPMRAGEAWAPPETPAPLTELTGASLATRTEGFEPTPEEPASFAEQIPDWVTAAPESADTALVAPILTIPEVGPGVDLPPLPAAAEVAAHAAESPSQLFADEAADLVPQEPVPALPVQAAQPPASAAATYSAPAAGGAYVAYVPAVSFAAPLPTQPLAPAPVTEAVPQPLPAVEPSIEPQLTPAAEPAPEPEVFLSPTPELAADPLSVLEPIAPTVPGSPPATAPVEEPIPASIPEPPAILLPPEPEPEAPVLPVLSVTEAPPDLPGIVEPASLAGVDGPAVEAEWADMLREQQIPERQRPVAVAPSEPAVPRPSVVVRAVEPSPARTPVEQPPTPPLTAPPLTQSRAAVRVSGAPMAVPHDVAGAAHVDPARAGAPEIVLTAPVEMWFGDYRVGVKEGTKTYQQFRRYADVMLADLKAAKSVRG